MAQQFDLFDVGTSAVGVCVTNAEDDLPRLAQEILALIGYEPMVRLVNKFGGVHIDMPRMAGNFAASAVLRAVADEIGDGAAHQLAHHFQGSRLHVPRCAKALRKVMERDIQAELDKGVAAHVLARRYQMTERSIWRIAKRA